MHPTCHINIYQKKKKNNHINLTGLSVRWAFEPNIPLKSRVLMAVAVASKTIKLSPNITALTMKMGHNNWIGSPSGSSNQTFHIKWVMYGSYLAESGPAAPHFIQQGQELDSSWV